MRAKEGGRQPGPPGEARVRTVLLLLAAVAACSCVPRVGGSVHMSARDLSDEWGADLIGGGVSVTVRDEGGFPLVAQVGYQLMQGTVIFEDYAAREYYLGVVWPWFVGDSRGRIDLGGGVVGIKGTREPVWGAEVEDSTLSGYIGAGFHWAFKEDYSLFADYRYVFPADIDLGGAYEAGGFEILVGVGFGFP